MKILETAIAVKIQTSALFFLFLSQLLQKETDGYPSSFTVIIAGCTPM